MRWWKTFREDFDRPSFQMGIERFGTCFVHDVGRTWQILCVEDGPGIRELPLTEEMIRVLARQFRVDTEETLARLKFMGDVGLIDLVSRNGIRNHVLVSKELKRRRDEWSARKARKEKGKSVGKTPESLPSHSGETPEQSQSQSQSQRSKSKGQSTESSSNVTRDNDDRDVTSRKVCCLTAKDPWKFCGLDIKIIPARFKKGRFAPLLREKFERYTKDSHQDGDCDCYVDEFIGNLRDECGKAGVEYPPALLARQIEIERAERASYAS